MGGQKTSKKPKTSSTKKVSTTRKVSNSKPIKRNYKSSSSTTQYAKKQKTTTSKIIIAIVVVAIIGIGLLIFNRVKAIIDVHNATTNYVETVRTISNSSGSSSSSSTTSDSSKDDSSKKMNVQAYKEVLNEYLDFMEEYVAFMKKYRNASSTEMSAMLSDYYDILNRQTQWAYKIDKYDDELKGELDEKDYAEFLKAYTDAINRAAKMMSDIYK